MCDIEEKIQSYLKEKSIFLENKCWDIRKSSLGGRGIFANRNILPGEIIFIDTPIIIGPRSKSDLEEICVVCFKIEELNFCKRKCGLKLCLKCQDSEQHQKECGFINSRKNGVDLETTKDITLSLTPIRALFLKLHFQKFFFYLKSHKHPKHNVLIDNLKDKINFSLSSDEEIFLKLVCSVLDANAFEVLISSNQKQSTVRGLYPLGSLANHNCSPNTTHVFDKHQRMIARAAVFIPKNTEICHSYSRITWGTLTRRYHLLRTKHFECKCSRCQDPTEFGTNLNGIKCEICKNVVLPEHPIDLKSKWKCFCCKEEVSVEKISFISNILGSNVKVFEKNEDVELIMKFLEKIKKLVVDNNQICVELKYKLIWILGYKQGYFYEDLAENLLCYKEEICKDLLELLKLLKTGMCKMRGLLLYELYQCGKEKIKRKHTENQEEINALLSEAADILLYDVDAPEEVQQLWNKTDVFD
ncbi:SET domain-containing protein SmydA-8-like [Onthophagus taurus]|uniref:SET domain-containing protein SmydA-8-like n=1 Tax=Onthophagus taurus TaxID=166361 RepID=UPI0039BEA328